MAVGADYPAEILNANGDVTEGITIRFTDAENQPSGDSVPFTPDDDSSNVVVAQDFDDNALIEAGVDGVKLNAPDDAQTVTVTAGGSTVLAAGSATGTGKIGFFGADIVVPPVDTVGALITLGLATAAITSGTLPNTGAWVSGTAKVNPVARDITVNVECVFDGTANAATVAILVSPDNTTFTTIGTPGVSAAINTVGGLTQLVPVRLPKGWFIKLTIAAHASVAASIYY